jgi:cytochrome c551
MSFYKLLSALSIKNCSTYLLFIALTAGCGVNEQKETDESFHVPENLEYREKLKFKQYAVQGRLLYKQHCANCHKNDGTGLGNLIPPLANSDYLLQNPQQVLCLIRWGMNGSITVNGKEYNQPMPANPQLKDIEIAEIATYIRNAWGNRGGFVSVQQAQEWLKCENQH